MNRRANRFALVISMVGLCMLLILAGFSAKSESPPAEEKKKPPVVQKSLHPRPGSPEFPTEVGPETVPKARIRATDTVPYVGDLLVDRLTLDKSEYAPGETVHVRYMIENTGNIRTRCTVEAYLTDDVSQLGPSTRFHQRDLNVGTTGSVGSMVDVQVPFNHSAGPMFVVMVVDVDDAVQEQNEDNNQRSATLTVKRPEARVLGKIPEIDARPDVSVDHLELPDAHVSRGDRVRVDFRINNHAEARIHEVRYRIVVGRVGEFSTTYMGPPVDQGSARDIAPGGYASVSRLFTMPASPSVCDMGDVIVQLLPGTDDDTEDNSVSAPIFIRCPED